MNFIQNWREKNKKKTIYKQLLNRHQTTIWGLEMAQEISNAEIQTTLAKEAELKDKSKELKTLMKEKYGEDKDIEAVRLEYEAMRKAQITDDPNLKTLEGKTAKAKELLKIAKPDLDIDVFIKELEGLFITETELLTIPKRIQGQEMGIQDAISAIGRNLKTIELIKEQIKKI